MKKAPESPLDVVEKVLRETRAEIVLMEREMAGDDPIEAEIAHLKRRVEALENRHRTPRKRGPRRSR